MNVYDKGDVVRITATTTNSTGAAADPTGLTFKIQVSGTTTTYIYGTDAALVRDTTGAFHVDWTIASAGVIHYYRWDATGAVAAGDEDAFDVRVTMF